MPITSQLSRRRYQRGSLTKDVDRWLGRWREDVIQPDGTLKRVRRSDVIASVKECPTKRLAQRKLDDRLREINREDYRPAPAETFGQFATRWMETVMVHHKPSTQRSERSVVSVHLVPAFGNLAFREVNTEMLQTWVSAHGLSPKTVRNIIVTLQTMWATAKAWGYTQVDPFEGLRLPKVNAGSSKFKYTFTLEEALEIIARAPRPWDIFFRILAEAGPRPGEVAGLLDSRCFPRAIQIAQSIWQGEVQTPKSEAAMRTFAISESLSQAIQGWVADESRPKSKTGLLFTNSNGQPLSIDNFRQRVLNPILEDIGIRGRMVDGQYVPGKLDSLGIKRCGNYAFRRLNATTMDGLGTPLATRQKRLGHAPGSDVTLRHYTSALDADDLAAADQIGALLRPKREGDSVQ